MVTCPNCGAETPENAEFCPKCGNPLNRPFEKSYKEMRREFRESRHTYRRGMWWSPEWSLLNAIMAGLLVIYIGAIIYLASSGLTSLVVRSNVWAYLLIGLGAFLFIRSVARYLIAGRRWGWFGGITAGLVLLVIGVAGVAISLTGLKEHIWTIVLVAGGFLIIAVGIANYLLMKRQA